MKVQSAVSAYWGFLNWAYGRGSLFIFIFAIGGACILLFAPKGILAATLPWFLLLSLWILSVAMVISFHLKYYRDKKQNP